MRLEKAATVLKLARRLAGGAEGMTIDDIATEFAVDRRTAERLRDAVRELFPQLEEIREGRSKRFVLPGGLDPFLETPTVEELVDLGLAAEAAERDGQTVRSDNLRALAAKVEARIRPVLRRRYAADIEALALVEHIAVRPGARPVSPPAVLRRLRSALLAMKQVSFCYRASGGGEPVTRRVDPCGLLFGSVYYLVARQAGTPEAVLWRLDRMSEVAILDVTSQPPTGFDLDVFAQRSFGVFQEPTEDVVLVVSANAAERVSSFHFHPTQKLQPRADGSIVLTLHTGGLLELCWHLFTWQGEIAIEGPDRLKRMMQQELARFSALAAPHATASDGPDN